MEVKVKLAQLDIPEKDKRFGFYTAYNEMADGSTEPFEAHMGNVYWAFNADKGEV